MWVCPPEGQDLVEQLRVFARCGVPGVVFSVDAAHLAWDMCPAQRHTSYTGKEGYPTVAFSVSCTHTKKITSVSLGFPGACNDKMMSRYDEFLLKIKNGDLFKDVTFTLRKLDGSSTQERGALGIADGGYHKWRFLQATDKHASEEYAAMLPKVMESLRNDIEDVFGIMEARHRILRGRIGLRNAGDIDAVMFTCAILHNMLLKDDGWADRHLMEAFWTNRGAGEYGASNNVAVDEEDDEAEDGPQFDYSAVRRGPGTRESEVDLVEERKDSYHVLRAKLVENFEVQWRAHAVEWLN